MRFHRPGNLTETLQIAWKRIEPTVNDRSAPIAHNRTLDFPEGVERVPSVTSKVPDHPVGGH